MWTFSKFQNLGSKIFKKNVENCKNHVFGVLRWIWHVFKKVFFYQIVLFSIDFYRYNFVTTPLPVAPQLHRAVSSLPILFSLVSKLKKSGLADLMLSANVTSTLRSTRLQFFQFTGQRKQWWWVGKNGFCENRTPLRSTPSRYLSTPRTVLLTIRTRRGVGIPPGRSLPDAQITEIHD